MSAITLSSSVRQNLLSLQSTADLLADHAEPPCHRQEGQLAPSTIPPTSSPRSRSTTRRRHQQPARRHRQRRADPAGRQHRHHLAAEADRHREVDRQPGAADAPRASPPRSSIDFAGSGAGTGARRPLTSTAAAARPEASSIGCVIHVQGRPRARLDITVGATYSALAPVRQRSSRSTT